MKKTTLYDEIHDCFSVSDVLIDIAAELGTTIERGTLQAELFDHVASDLKWLHNKLKELDVRFEEKQNKWNSAGAAKEAAERIMGAKYG